MKITILINGKKHERELPTSWDDPIIDFEMYLALEKVQNDFIKVFGVLTGLDPEDLRKAKIQNLDTVISLLSFLRREPKIDMPCKLLGKYKVSGNLGFETLEEYVDLKKSIEDSIKEKKGTERYPLYCAIYACKAKHGEYDWQKAEEMQSEFLKAPALEVLAVGNFTVKRYIGWMKGLTDASPEPSTPNKNDKLASKSSPKPTGSTARYSTLKGKRRSTAKKS